MLSEWTKKAAGAALASHSGRLLGYSPIWELKAPPSQQGLFIKVNRDSQWHPVKHVTHIKSL